MREVDSFDLLGCEAPHFPQKRACGLASSWPHCMQTIAHYPLPTGRRSPCAPKIVEFVATLDLYQGSNGNQRIAWPSVMDRRGIPTLSFPRVCPVWRARNPGSDLPPKKPLDSSLRRLRSELVNFSILARTSSLVILSRRAARAVSKDLRAALPHAPLTFMSCRIVHCFAYRVHQRPHQARRSASAGSRWLPYAEASS